MTYPAATLDDTAIEAFSPAEKIGLVASVSPERRPHITLITSIRAAGPSQITLGEFCKGTSKANIQQHPEIAFCVMTMDRRMWRGHARWSHLKNEGPEYQAYNDLPMFRYNAYFGIHTVHYLDLVDARGPEKLPLGRILASAVLSRAAAGGANTAERKQVLTPFARDLFNRMDALKFLVYIRDDGFPEIIPLLQCRAAGSRRLVFSPMAYGGELRKVPIGTQVAVFALTLQMESVLTRGAFTGFSRSRMIQAGSVDIEWVYNSMPPAHGRIYPPVRLEPVTRWTDFYDPSP
ncbi:MAG: hypothetical protein KGY42_02575 [Desulfobacterales bacterium]|nr:hypothetical protein [Desulfobacterales bacterium]